jgi:hypothetical protein
MAKKVAKKTVTIGKSLGDDVKRLLAENETNWFTEFAKLKRRVANIEERLIEVAGFTGNDAINARIDRLVAALSTAKPIKKDY